ncbi:hypothetical protein CMV_007707 [Castanea mollissima]|uniref:HAT C-terminal dimerisation domain-containing protein n=1 Tax=Castanea mollissima TaxID=60419 RepID=A0A8J4RHX4_9ROSI|nr:hypothetical protein CMV_007707 [Castanea mollissima]
MGVYLMMLVPNSGSGRGRKLASRARPRARLAQKASPRRRAPRQSVVLRPSFPVVRAPSPERALETLVWRSVLSGGRGPPSRGRGAGEGESPVVPGPCRTKKRLWEPYVNIIKDRWDNQFYRDIHTAAYWLNPAFQYDSSTLNKRLETQSAVTNVIESKVSVGQLKLVEELRLFREREQTFGTQLAQESAKTSQPDEWWKLFGSCAPTLQKFAIRILSQTAASSGCERNWSAFEQIHSKRRNRLEHQRLNDLVYVHYNYRLKERVKRKKFNFDPIDYASIDKTEFWVVEDEEPPFLDHEEIENALYEEGAHPIEEGSSSHVQRDMDNEVIEDDDDINLESFGDEDDAPPGFRDKNHPIPIEDEENEDEDDDNDASGGAFGLHDDIDFNFLHNK